MEHDDIILARIEAVREQIPRVMLAMAELREAFDLPASPRKPTLVWSNSAPE